MYLALLFAAGEAKRWASDVEPTRLASSQGFRRSELNTISSIIVELSDGREIAVPISWYPRLENASNEELMRWEFIGKGQGIHWEDLDEDISVSGLLAGNPCAESSESLQRRLSSREA